MLLILKNFKVKVKVNKWYEGEKVCEYDLGSWYESTDQLLYKQNYRLERHWTSNLLHKIISYLKNNHLAIMAMLISILIYCKA